ncbi:elongator complex protein 4 [Nematocida sp. AWRm77]|nr:elongator complex protein 4 [Nematocida sp. AWRm77]
MFKKLAQDGKQEKRATGTEELDALLGGGMEQGTLLLLVQGEDVKYHLGFHRVFLSQGLEENATTVHVSLDNPRLLIPSLQTQQHTGMHAHKEGKEEGRAKIAWRYAAMSGTAHTATLGGASTAISQSKKYDLKTPHRHAEKVVQMESTSVSEIESRVSSLQGGRLSISSLFSPLWSMSSGEIAQYLFDLRRLVKIQDVICMVSVPVHLLDSFVYGYFDYVFGLETNRIPSLKYDGILETLKTEGSKRCKYGVKCRSTGITIEKIVLPPV